MGEFDIGSAAAGLLGGLGSLVGGIYQNKAQKSANKTNLQIAQETNQLQRDMFNQQLQFNSFQNQRKMLEEAGYSPYSLFGTSSVAAPSAPQLHAPTMIPEDAFGVGIGNAMGNFANIAKTFAEAQSANEDVKSKRIHNAVYQTELYNQLVSQGLQNEWQKIQNYIAEGSKEEQMNTYGLQNELLHGQWKLTIEQYNLAVIEAGLRKEYGSRLNDAELEKKAADAFAAWQKGWLDEGELAHIDDKYKSMLLSAEAAQSQAETAKFRAPAQNASDYASARYQNSVAAFNEYDFDYMKSLGLSKLASETQKLRSEYDLNMKKGKSEVQNRELIKALHDKYQAEIDILITNGKYQEAQNLSTIFSKVVGSLTGAAGAAGSLMPQ